MKAIVYSEPGGPEVLRLVERPVPEPGPGEVRVHVHVSGVNPTDWKSRRSGSPFPEQVPGQDGAGEIDAVTHGIRLTVGQRVWIWEAAWQRPDGTAQEYVVLPVEHVVPLPDDASYDLGASLGIPALTAHRCLTVGRVSRLHPGSLKDQIVLVAGGAGAVGHAAIQLARWAGATVVTTVSTPEKAELARAAGAHHVVNYRTENAATVIREVAPDGVDLIVEVAPAPNAELDQAVIASNGVVSVYADNGGEEVTLHVSSLYRLNVRYQFILVYTVPPEAKKAAIEDVSAAVAAGALQVGKAAGLPLHRFPLERTADAHEAVESGTVGKVLIDLV
ncbi:NADPH:quinone reductase [Sphaerisporangium sp. NPDC088356]|uniref:NADPH:quinone reductase n=1 Tax=Sphaerisporangium sp. NPDC088356 TaxID=3154871 RepID=UPI00343AC56B